MVAAPEFPSDRRLDRLAREIPFRVSRALPGGASLPIAFNLQAYGRA